jgi:hypothetical protein
VKVKFSTADEFLAELTKEAKLNEVDDSILRLTYSYRQDRHIPLAYLSVVAGVVIRGKIVELNQYVGEVMTGAELHDGSSRVKAKAEIIRVNIEAKARELNLEIRAGMFEP